MLNYLDGIYFQATNSYILNYVKSKIIILIVCLAILLQS